MTDTKTPSDVVASDPLASAIMHHAQDAMANMVESGKIAAIIEDQIAKTVSRTLEHALSSYSEFGRGLEAEMKRQIGVNLGKLGLGEYNARLLALTEKHINDQIEGVWAEDYKSRLTQMLANAPESITLEDLGSKIVQSLIDSHDLDPREADCVDVGDEHWPVWVHRGDGDSVFWLDIAWTKETSERWDCPVSILIADGTISSVRGASTLGRRSEIRPTKFGDLSGYERELFRLATGRTVLEVGNLDEGWNELHVNVEIEWCEC
jgi:hypothetical protein